VSAGLAMKPADLWVPLAEAHATSALVQEVVLRLADGQEVGIERAEAHAGMLVLVPVESVCLNEDRLPEELAGHVSVLEDFDMTADELSLLLESCGMPVKEAAGMLAFLSDAGFLTAEDLRKEWGEE